MNVSHLVDSVKNYTEKAMDQEVKGIHKYGKALDPHDDYDWLEMAKEELADAYKYLHAEHVKRKYIVAEIRKLTDNSEIHQLLNRL